MFANAHLTSVPSSFLRVARNIMLTRSQLAAIKKNLVIKNDKKEKVFYADIENHRATIEYEEEGGVLKLMYTNVPKELEGHGIGTKLAKGTFDYIAKTDQKVEVHCDFLKHFIERHGKEYKNLLK